MTIAAVITNGIGPGGSVPYLLTVGFGPTPAPVIFDDSHDPGLRKRHRQERERIAAEDAKRHGRRAQVIEAYERIVEGKPELAAELAREFSVPRPTPQFLSAPPPMDFTRLAADIDAVQRLMDALLELDDEDILYLM